jgi:predicted secreted protein
MSARDPEKDPAPPTVTVTEADRGKDITVPAGGILIVRLASNPTTGYRWHYVTAPDSLFRLKEHAYQAQSAPPGFTGGGGAEELQFVVAEGAEPGSEQAEWLRLLSLRSFAQGLEGATTWAVRLIVPAA